jgi:hypothetical protein
VNDDMLFYRASMRDVCISHLRGARVMQRRLTRAVVLCAMVLALTGCIFSRGPIFDISKGATDLPAGRFEVKSGQDKSTVELARHGSLYLYSDGDSPDTAILSFHGIGDEFYLVVAMPPGRDINYGVVDARSHDRLAFTFLECGDDTPTELVPGPDTKGLDRCVADDRERLIAIANHYKADLLADRIEVSKLQEFAPIPR